MKNNLKTKVMLAVLAGGMLCANGAFAADIWWYGTTGNQWTNIKNNAVASGLTLTITDETKVGDDFVTAVGKQIYGGYTDGSLEVKNNAITFNTTNATTIAAEVYGGQNSKDGGAATYNHVTIEGGKFTRYISGGCSSKGVAEENTVTIKGGNFTNYIFGGRTTSGIGNAGNATNNIVTIEGGTFSGSNAWIRGGFSNKGNAIGNKVTIEGGTFEDAKIYGGYSGSGNVTGNIVTIKGGTFNNAIYGGKSDNGDATGNIVTIEGGTFSDDFLLYGGLNGFEKTSSGNILNLKTKITRTDGTNSTANTVRYFQIMNFTLPADIANGDIMLKTKKVFFDDTVINVDAVTGTRFAKDSVITLVSATTTMSGDVIQGTIPTGSELNLTDNKLLTLTFTSDYIAPAKPEEKAVLEGVAASLAFVNQGADMVAGSGIDGLYVADSENPTIAAFSGNKTRYNTGSHVDIHGWNALAGVALNNKKSFSHGVFVEIGNGDIDTYAALNGSGSSDYKGGGYMLRKDLGKGWNLDGAVRAGRVETSWSNNDKGGYEAKQTYYGAHVTFNKMLKEYGEQKLNGYLRYTFTHLGSDSVNLDGTHYGFDSVNSHRTRLGARMVEEGQNGFELYYGAAWEYGFGGDCDATVNGVTTSGPAVDGSNAVFEVGGTWSDKKWDISAGLEGYAGAKRGVAGGMNFIYKF